MPLDDRDDEPTVGNYPDELADLMVGLAKLRDAEHDYQQAHDYFTGNVPEFFASAKLARRIEKTGTSFRVNVAKKAVTAVTDRMEIGSVVAIGANGKGQDRLTKALMEQVWNPNELTLEAPDWHERAGEFGDGYLFVWPTELAGESDQALGVDLFFSSPIGTRAVYDPENPRRIRFVIKTWDEGAGERKVTRVNLYYFGAVDDPDEGKRGRIEKWVTLEGTNGTEAEHWTEYQVDGEPWPLPNPYGQVVWHFRTARPYGVPLHREAYGSQDAINKLIVSLMNTVDFHLLPQRAALMDGEADEDDDDFDDFTADEDETLTDEQKKALSGGLSKMKSGPGELWLLKNTRALVQMDAADPDNFLKPTEFFMRMMAQVNDMPLHFFDPGGDQPSGDSRRQAEGTLTNKVDRLEDAFEPVWSGALTKAMHMLGFTNVVRVDVRWTPAETVDDADGWTTAKAKIDAGVPVQQVLIEAGYEPEQVAGWLTNNDEQDLRRRVALLGELAKAVRDMGTGVGMGVIPPELVQQVMAGFLPTADDDGTGGGE